MGRGGRGGRGGGGGGRGGRGGYDWRKHTRPSDDPAVQDAVRSVVNAFAADPRRPESLEVECSGQERNTYKAYCRQMGLGFVKGSRRGTNKILRSAGDSSSPFLLIWCHYYRDCCGVDLMGDAQRERREREEKRRKRSALALPAEESPWAASAAAEGDEGAGGASSDPVLPDTSEWDNDDCDAAWDDTDDEDEDNDIGAQASSPQDGKPAAEDDVADVLDEDAREAEEVSRLAALREAERQDDDDDMEDDGGDSDKLTLDTTDPSFDGRRSWIKVRDLLQDIKRSSDGSLWESCCALGINNCSERKLEPHAEEFGRFFEVQGTGPQQKLRGRKLRVEVDGGTEARIVGGESSVTVEYAKPVLYSDVNRLSELIRLVDDANSLLSRHRADGRGKAADIFNRSWRSRARTIPPPAGVDPVYEERKRTLRSRLPAFSSGDDFVQRVFDNDVVVLCGATGSGKTTQLPQILMEAASSIHSGGGGSGSAGRSFGTGRIVCTQPRRISATSVAERVAYERNEGVGERVGYQIRFEHRASDTTELLYCTTGILLRFLVGNPKLEGVACVIIDEVHERSIHSDFVLLLMRRLILERQHTDEPLKLVLMSATIDASNFISYFDSNFSVSFLQIPGKTNYPIEEHFLEDICENVPSVQVRGPPPMNNSRGPSKEPRNVWASSAGAVKARYRELGFRSGRPNRVYDQIANALQRPHMLDVDLICSVVEHIESSEPPIADGGDGDDFLGSVLIFAPGWKEITDVMKGLERKLNDCRRRCAWARDRDWTVLPLHSQVPQSDQMRIFDKPRPGRRKIIVSTNLAETSITVEDVVYVVDPGLSRGTTYSAHTNIASLETFLVSRSNVQQRRGRSGRCRPGKFYKLYTEYEFAEEMRDHEEPEMQRTPVEELCLMVKTLDLGGLSIREILSLAINPPEPKAVENGIQLLMDLGALKPVAGGAAEELTPLGDRLAQIPVHPAIGKCLLMGSLFSTYGDGSCGLRPLIAACATLSYKSPFVLPFGKEKEADRARKWYGHGLLSDHRLFAKVSRDYARWRNSSRGEFARWADDNFLSPKTLKMTEQIEFDLCRHVDDLSRDGPGGRQGGGDRRAALTSGDMSPSLLVAILGASLSISFTAPGTKKLSSLGGGAPCSVHPSSLCVAVEDAGNERMLWKKYRHLLRGQQDNRVVEEFVVDEPEKLFIVGWFERLKTSDVYLRDVSLIRDPLPLLLLLPGVERRGEGSTADDLVFEVVGGKSSQGGESGADQSQGKKLLLKAKDGRTADLLLALRQKLFAFLDMVLSQTQGGRSMSPQLEDALGRVISELQALFERSHAMYDRNSSFNRDPEVVELSGLHDAAHCVAMRSGDGGEEASDSEDEVRIERQRGPSSHYGDYQYGGGGRGNESSHYGNQDGGRGRGYRRRNDGWGRGGNAKRGRGGGGRGRW